MAEQTLTQKLVELQRTVRALQVDSENKGFKYRYISGSKVLSVVRPKMDELGLTLTQTVEPSSIQISGSSIFMVLRFVWTDSASGERLEVLWPSAGQNSSLDKAIGCAMTYGERYFLMKQLHIATDEDDVDAQEPTKAEPRKAQAKGPKVYTMAGFNAGEYADVIDYLSKHIDPAKQDLDTEAVKVVNKPCYQWEEGVLDVIVRAAKKKAFVDDLNGHWNVNFTELSTPSIMDQVIGHSSAKVPYRKVKTFATKQEAQAWADSVRGDGSIKVTSIEQEIPMLHTSSYSEDPFLQLQRVSKRNCERLRLKGVI